MIQLDESMFIGNGCHRRVYHHPKNKDWCIKVSDSNRVAQTREKREILFYKRLQKKGVSFNNISPYIETIETNLGRGCIYEKVTDFDGELSKDLYTVLSNDPSSEHLITNLQKLGAFLKENSIFFYDDLLKDNTLCRKNEDSSYTLKIIDGLGDTVLIPVLNWIPHLAKARVEKKWKRHMTRIIKKEIPEVNIGSLKI